MSELPVGILLAAGQSRRFGSNKLLHPIIDNTPMLFIAAERLVGVMPEVIVVINQDLLSYAVQLEQRGLRVIVNTDADSGIGSSIACGVRGSSSAMGWLIALADMPYIKTETIRQLNNLLKNGADIIAPVYDQQRGHPVGFSHRYKDELLALQDDVGARQIISNNQHCLELVATDDVGVITDIDQLEDIVV